jgi:hypothetical protein
MHRPVEIEFHIAVMRPGAVGLDPVFDQAMGGIVELLRACGVRARGQAAEDRQDGSSVPSY